MKSVLDAVKNHFKEKWDYYVLGGSMLVIGGLVGVMGKQAIDFVKTNYDFRIQSALTNTPPAATSTIHPSDTPDPLPTSTPIPEIVPSATATLEQEVYMEEDVTRDENIILLSQEFHYVKNIITGGDRFLPQWESFFDYICRVPYLVQDGEIKHSIGKPQCEGIDEISDLLSRIDIDESTIPIDVGDKIKVAFRWGKSYDEGVFVPFGEGGFPNPVMEYNVFVAAQNDTADTPLRIEVVKWSDWNMISEVRDYNLIMQDGDMKAVPSETGYSSVHLVQLDDHLTKEQVDAGMEIIANYPIDPSISQRTVMVKLEGENYFRLGTGQYVQTTIMSGPDEGKVLTEMVDEKGVVTFHVARDLETEVSFLGCSPLINSPSIWQNSTIYDKAPANPIEQTDMGVTVPYIELVCGRSATATPGIKNSPTPYLTPTPFSTYTPIPSLTPTETPRPPTETPRPPTETPCFTPTNPPPTPTSIFNTPVPTDPPETSLLYKREAIDSFLENYDIM